MAPYLGKFLAETPDLAWHHGLRSRSTLPSPEKFELGIMPVLFHQDLGKLVFVPKSAKTHRPIVVEPALNGLWQLGVGSYLKGRLASLGIDLRDQEVNRKLALQGSITGSHATIDLKSASDTLSLGVVSELVPSEWVEFLHQLRTGHICYDDRVHELEKFSSMGNGFTFELESSIFWAIARACMRVSGVDDQELGIYGDDIVIPTNAVSLLMEVLDWAGFWVNPQKSFWTGSFRESCGADWLNGHDVRPFYIKDEVSDRVLYTLHNWALRRGERELAALALDTTWPSVRLHGPDGYGDGHLIGSYSLYTKRQHRRDRWVLPGWKLSSGCFDTYTLVPKRHQVRRDGDWLIPGYTSYVRSGAESPTDPH